MQRSARRLWASLGWIAMFAPTPQLDAQDTPPTAAEVLSGYYKAFASKRLVSTETAKVAEVRKLLQQAEELSQAGRDEDAVLLLYELTEHPRFADYAPLAELQAAHYALGSALHALGAEPAARAALVRVLAVGPEHPYFAPAYRRYVDVALSGEPIAPALTELAAYSGKLPEDAQNELYYLQARERQEAGDIPAAKTLLAQVTRHSRFYANAQYQLGALAADEQRWRSAEQHFCKIADAKDDGRYSFYVDGRYFRVKDLARLGLGRVAHEQRRGEDAFYYYFQVPNDSPRLPESMFEGAYARYEAGDYQTALDLLDQLQARFPSSAYADEASLLRGYVALSNCQFDRANKQFDQFTARFEPVVAEIGRILRNPARREVLYEEMSADESARAKRGAVHRTLLALLRVDPDFNDLRERLSKLDRETARAGHLPESFDLLAARYQGADRPHAVVDTTPTDKQQLAELQQELSDLRAALRALTEQLDTMRSLGAKSADLAPHEDAAASLMVRVRKLESGLDDVRLELMPKPIAAAPSGDVAQLLAADEKQAAQFERRALQLRPRLVAAANQRALAELTALHERLSGFLRRARIGRIDAVMGSKRQVEIQIESLAAGRFPPELRNPLLIQGFLADDEEYWPFEGEDWPDEYLERYGDDATQVRP